MSGSQPLDALARAHGVAHVQVGGSAVALLEACEPDIVLNAIVGFAGVEATLWALEHGVTLALANKESLVAAGELAVAAHRRGGGLLLPVDSEHSALFQCLEGRAPETVEALVLTASGGPFRGRSTHELANVTIADALAHPTWSMGRKITVDSATLANKGLELIEAHWLFGVPYEQHRGRRAPGVDRSFARSLPRRRAPRPPRQPRHARPDLVRARLPRSAGRRRPRRSTSRRGSTSGSRRSTARRSRCCRSRALPESAAGRPRARTTRRTRSPSRRSSTGGSGSWRSPRRSPALSTRSTASPARDLDGSRRSRRRGAPRSPSGGSCPHDDLHLHRRARVPDLHPRARALLGVARAQDAAAEVLHRLSPGHRQANAEGHRVRHRDDPARRLREDPRACTGRRRATSTRSLGRAVEEAPGLGEPADRLRRALAIGDHDAARAALAAFADARCRARELSEPGRARGREGRHRPRRRPRPRCLLAGGDLEARARHLRRARRRTSSSRSCSSPGST